MANDCPAAPRGLVLDADGRASLRPIEPRPLREGEARLRVALASIKHGTTLHHLSGHSPFSDRKFDLKQRLFVPLDAPLGVPESWMRMGNMVAGAVIEAAPGSPLSVGQQAYGYGAMAEQAILSRGQSFAMPEGLSPEQAVCLDPALFAYAAVRDARATAGDNVVLFGLGAIGLFAVQLLRLSGCLNLVAVDPAPLRRQRAKALGADVVLDPTACDVAIEVRRLLGRGCDIAIEASGAYRALADAIRSVHQCCRVVTLGYYKGRDSQLELGADFFHNRLELICSMPDWQNPLREHPAWDWARLWSTLERFFTLGRLTADGILDPVVPFEQAPAALERLMADPAQTIKFATTFG